MREELTCSGLSVHRRTLSASCDLQIRPFSPRANIGTQDHWFSHRSRNPDRFHVRNITDKTESYQNPEIDRAGERAMMRLAFNQISQYGLDRRYGGREGEKQSNLHLF